MGAQHHNGYDPDDIRPLPLPTNSRFTLTYIGSFNRGRTPDAFIKAVRLLTENGRIDPQEMRLVFVGRQMTEFIPDDVPFERHDFVPFNQLEQFRAQTDALLLLLNTDQSNQGKHSAKLMEYIASNRPILAVVPPGGAAADLVTRTKTGIVTDGDYRHIADALEAMYKRWQQNDWHWTPDWATIELYSRRYLTGLLAAEFDQLTRQR